MKTIENNRINKYDDESYETYIIDDLENQTIDKSIKVVPHSSMKVSIAKSSNKPRKLLET